MPQPLKSAFRNAAAGIAHAFTQRNMRIHAVFAVAAVALGFALRIDTASWLAVLLCIGGVFSLEVLNTAVEALVDLVSPDYHKLAGRAKDCAAGAVLVMAAVSVVVACVVYLPGLEALLWR